jgi:pyroglutamyl-peptidase
MATILITGFGPFPGVRFNPTGPLAVELARKRHPAFAGVRRLAHVFHVSYEAIDRDLPALLERERPDAVVMFGLAVRSKHVRIEMCAHNTLAPALPDAAGRAPVGTAIVPGGPTIVRLHAPAQRLLLAARTAGVPAVLSRDAGRYLCNYLCWRAAEAAASGAPRLTAFIHVPALHRTQAPSRRPALTLDDLARAGEAIVRAALAAR